MLVELSVSEMSIIDGGHKKCKKIGRAVGEAIRDSVLVEAIESAYDTVCSWFD